MQLLIFSNAISSIPSIQISLENYSLILYFHLENVFTTKAKYFWDSDHKLILTQRVFVMEEKNPRLNVRQIHIWIPALPLTSSVISDRLLNLSEPWVSNLKNQEIIPISQRYENEVRHRTASETTGHSADNAVFGPRLAHRSLAWIIPWALSPTWVAKTRSCSRSEPSRLCSSPKPLIGGFIHPLPRTWQEARGKREIGREERWRCWARACKNSLSHGNAICQSLRLQSSRSTRLRILTFRISVSNLFPLEKEGGCELYEEQGH